jgi:hypothetical protein
MLFLLAITLFFSQCYWNDEEYEHLYPDNSGKTPVDSIILDTMNVILTNFTTLPYTKDSVEVYASQYWTTDHVLYIPINNELFIESHKNKSWIIEKVDIRGNNASVPLYQLEKEKTIYHYWLADTISIDTISVMLTFSSDR